jgi:tetratricopeptide (TPR) repeat protein
MNESVTKWLKAFEVAPVEKLRDLVLGRTAVSAWSRASLREVFLEIFQTHAELLDTAVTGWLHENLLKEPPDQLPLKVWASYAQDVFQGITGLPLSKVAYLLRDNMRDFRLWLRPLRFEESLDAEAAYLIALAWAKSNQRLDGMWRALALRQHREPMYYTDIGLLGLRMRRDEQEKLPEKAPFILLATLIDLTDNLPHAEWELTTRAVLGGYHCNLETWAREFEYVLKTHSQSQNGLKWLKKILPQIQIPEIAETHSANSLSPPHTIQERDAIIAEVEKSGPGNLGQKLQSFLERHRFFASATRNPHFLVRTFNRLAESAQSHNPTWAVERAEESLSWDEYNAHGWTVLARSLWARGIYEQQKGGFAKAESDFREAIDVLWTARFRFPFNGPIRTELAKLCRRVGDLGLAESIYREAIAEFPFDPWCFTGLADMLAYRSKQTGSKADQDEARQLFNRAASLGNKYAERRLRDFKQGGFSNPTEGEMVEVVELKAQSLLDMRPAQRLGRALLLQWQARQSASAEERERLFNEAEKLLDLPQATAGDCWTAFVEARGFLLLARNRVTDARAYFEQQLAVAKNRSLGLRLGFAEARIRLGEKLNDNDEAELASFGPDGSILPLVLKVLRLLESNEDETTLRDILLQIYPRARELAGMPLSELGEDEEVAETAAKPSEAQTADSMMAHLLIADVFRPAKIENLESLKEKDALSRVRSAFNQHRNEIFSVVEKLALAA